MIIKLCDMCEKRITADDESEKMSIAFQWYEMGSGPLFKHAYITDICGECMNQAIKCMHENGYDGEIMGVEPEDWCSK